MCVFEDKAAVLGDAYWKIVIAESAGILFAQLRKMITEVVMTAKKYVSSLRHLLGVNFLFCESLEGKINHRTYFALPSGILTPQRNSLPHW